MADWDNFELFPVKYGTGSSGWTGLHVKVRLWIRPKGFEDKDGMICLTPEAENSEELNGYIDELIAELQQLKVEGRKKFTSLRRKAQTVLAG